MPVVEDVVSPITAPPFSPLGDGLVEDSAPKLALKTNGTQDTHAKGPVDVISKLKESLNTLRASIQGDPLSDPRYVTLLKLLKNATVASPSSAPATPIFTTPHENGFSNGGTFILNGTADGPTRGEDLRKTLTEQQKRQLLAQIKAYKCLSRNLPVPPEVITAMGGLTMMQPVRSSIVPFMCPPTLLRGGSVGNSKRVASALSEAIGVAHERERRIHTKIQLRMEELKVLPTNIVPALKKQAQIELKELKLLDFQKKIRAEISGEVQHIRELESAQDMAAYRRLNPNQGEEEELDVDVDGEQSKHAIHRKFLNALHYHAKEFKEFHIQKDKNVKKLLNRITQYHKEKEKKEAIKAERLRRERINYLKNNDVEAYEQAIKGMKNERLTQLLRQTGDFLGQMGVLVAQEKGEGGGSTTEDKDKDKDKSDAPTTTSKTYYTAAHAIQEEVKEQPEMLVGGQLKEYQLSGVQWLVSLYNNKLNGILADEMGLGKTIQTIGLISYLMEKKGNNGPYMVAVPLSTTPNWTNEFAKWAPKINVVAYGGKPAERKQLFTNIIQKHKFNVVLVSFEYIMIDKNDLQKINWEYVILDEGHRIKNKNSKLSTTLRQYSSKHRLLLTGTPLQNDLTELWALLNFLLPTIFNSRDNFEVWFNSPFAYDKNAKNKALQVNEEESLIVINRLHQVLRPFLLRRLKADVESQLPDKVERVLKCSLSAMQHVMYEQIGKRGVMITDPNSANYKRSTKGFNNVIMQLQKVCNHPYLFRDEWDVDENMVRVSGKFELMDRMLVKLKATKHRVLIFTQMTHVITIMELYFELRGFDYLRLDGQTKQEDRASMVKEWNRPESPYFIFVLSTHAGGLGLNLQTADTVIIFDTDWNPHMDLQAQDRAHRIGQTQEVRVFRLVVQNSLEEKILERASFKLNIDAKIIQAGMFNNNASDEMRREMLEGLLRGYDKAEEEDEVVTSNEQLNNALARNDKEFEIFQRMDNAEEEEWARKHKKGEIRSRLITYEELPAWMTQDPADLNKEELPENYGKGKRARSEVNYDDGLTENQFLRMMEKGISYEDVRAARAKRREAKKKGEPVSSSEDDLDSDTSQEQQPQVKPKKTPKKEEKGKPKHVKQNLDEFTDEEEEILEEMEHIGDGKVDGEFFFKEKKKSLGKRKKVEDADSSDRGEGDGAGEVEPPHKRQKVELKLKITLNKNKDKDKDTPSKEKEKKEKEKDRDKEKERDKDNAKDTPKEKGKRGRKPKSSGKMQEIYKNIWQAVRAATDDSGRVLSALFMELPSAEDYPNYYDVIDNPVSMAQIKRKKYSSPADFRRDFVTMFDNAKEYNEAGSQVYSDATTLMRILDEQFNKYQKELEGGAGAEGEGEEEGEDDTDASSTAGNDGEEVKKKRGRPKKEKSIIIIKKEKDPKKEKVKEEDVPS